MALFHPATVPLFWMSVTLVAPTYSMEKMAVLSGPSCHPFSFPGDSRLVTLPTVDEKYLPDLECIRLLRAEPGYTISLRFAASFHLEEDNQRCSYDYLEIRDGPYGYSPLLKRLCGAITHSISFNSSGQYMRLKFGSDHAIERTGFVGHVTQALNKRIDYLPTLSENIPLDASSCYIKIRAFRSGVIRKTDIPHDVLSLYERNPGQPVDCVWDIIAENDHSSIFLDPDEYQRRSFDNCDTDKLRIYDGRPEEANIQSDECGRPDKVTTSSRRAIVRLIARHWDNAPDFSLIYTVYRKVNCSESGWFLCSRDKCIPNSMRCDGVINCADERDEQCLDNEGKNRNPRELEHITLLLFCGIGAFISVTVILSINGYMKFIKTDRLRSPVKTGNHEVDQSQTSLLSSPTLSSNEFSKQRLEPAFEGCP